jgi:hypothetical protein
MGERGAKNQARYREANLRIVEEAQRLGFEADDRIPLLCECLDSSCTSTTRLSTTEFKRLARAEHRFLTVPGHQLLPGQRVVEENDRYAITSRSD